MNQGLDGVVVAQTVLSQVDGAAGELIVRGHRIDELTGRVSFEEMTALLWKDLVPEGETSAAQIRSALARGRVDAFAHVANLAELAALAPNTAPLSAVESLRLGLASLPGAAPDPHHRAAAAVAVFVASFERLRQGLPPVAPDTALGQAADFLRMLRGQPASPAEQAALDAYLVTVAEHGMNASTFTARVVASTRAGVLPAVIAALSALEGPLHGGAPGPVLDMLDAIGERHNIRPWLAGELAAGRRLMGFGHRIYRLRDPRADVLKAQVARLRGTGRDRLAFAEEVEREALAALARHRPQRPLDTNVEFYTALLLDALGIDRRLFTAVFALGRVAGWTAHVFEQQRADRLIRPQSQYVGPSPPGAGAGAGASAAA
jgi:citrate synthase